MRRVSPPSGDLAEILKGCLPDDHARQVTDRYYVDLVMQADPAPQVVVDLGCGRRTSVSPFRANSPDVTWVGIDIGDSMEAQQRTREDVPFVHYDGWDVPLAD